MRIPYDAAFDPPAPVLPLRVSLPRSGGWLQVVGLVDTGADITLIPQDVAEPHLPVAGIVGVRGVTGDVLDAVLYRAEFRIGSAQRTLIVAGFGSDVIVGRDLLGSLLLNLDGPARRMTVTLP